MVMPKSVQKPRILDTLEIESNTSWAIWCLEMVGFKCSNSCPIVPPIHGNKPRGGFISGSDSWPNSVVQCNPNREKDNISSVPRPEQIYNPGCPRSSRRRDPTRILLMETTVFPHSSTSGSTTLRSKPGIQPPWDLLCCSRWPDDSHTTSATPTYHPFLSPTSDAPA